MFAPIFDETKTGMQQLMMALLKIGFDWTRGGVGGLKLLLAKLCLFSNVIISDIQSIFMSYLMIAIVVLIGGVFVR